MFFLMTQVLPEMHLPPVPWASAHHPPCTHREPPPRSRALGCLVTHTGPSPGTSTLPTFHRSWLGNHRVAKPPPANPQLEAARLPGLHLLHFYALSTLSRSAPWSAPVRRNQQDADRQGAAAGKKVNLKFTLGPNCCSSLLKIPRFGPQNFPEPWRPGILFTLGGLHTETKR